MIIPVVAECDDSFLNDARRMQVTRDDVGRRAGRRAVGRPRRGPATAPGEGAIGSGTGMSCLGFKGGIGTASRIVPPSGAGTGVHRRGTRDDATSANGTG